MRKRKTQGSLKGKDSQKLTTKQSNPLLPSESQIQKSVLQFLKNRKDVLAIRLNNLPVPLKSGGFRPVAVRGIPDCHVDFLVNKVPVSVWVEFKAPKGKLSEYQKQFKSTIEDMGGFYEVIRSIDEMEDALTRINGVVSETIANAELKG